MDPILLTALGTVLAISLTIIGYFLKITHTDQRNTTLELGKLKGKVELLDQKSNVDIKHLQETTQKEFSAMTTNINELAKNVNKLVMALAKRNIIDERNQEE